MAGAQAGAVVPVKVLVEQNVVPEVGVILEKSISTVNRPLAVAIAQK
jgi:hypothetical protein